MLLDSNLFSNNDFTVFISANNCKSYKWRSVYNLSAVTVAETPTILLPPPGADSSAAHVHNGRGAGRPGRQSARDDRGARSLRPYGHIDVALAGAMLTLPRG